ncbi:MAG: tryptophan synthase subunit alpha [Candidatus Palauibacterales bacterium]|nr:tryptophan synthase subunit alpha [Candidatus Palauibacterales bacterium]
MPDEVPRPADEPVNSGDGERRIGEAIARAKAERRPAIAAFLTAGFPTRERFASLLSAAAAEADLVEVGVPFSDPMADGLTIQRSSRVALENGTTLPWILETIGEATRAGAGAGSDTPPGPTRRSPVLLMSYLNPILAHGFGAFASDGAGAGIAGLIVPDLPLEESHRLRAVLAGSGIALVQLVTPATPPGRLERVCEASRGFVYAVTMKGTTGARVDAAAAAEYLARVRRVSPVPVLAGFGVRSATDVAGLAGFADGVIVGSALVEAIERGVDPGMFVRELRGEEMAS